MDPRAADWFASATTSSADWPVEAVMRAKGTRRISVVIPARNEAATIGEIIDGIGKELVADVPLVDELVVIDSDSTDDTAALAADAGATVHRARDIRPDLGTHR